MTLILRRHVAAVAVTLCVSTGLAAAELPYASAPEDVGLSSERLARIGEVLSEGMERGEIPGFVALVMRRGKIAYHEAFGVQDPVSGKAMAKDSIFRIYSMTKPITSTAVMILVEEGKIKLSDPIARYLPELGDMTAATNADSAAGPDSVETEPIGPPIRIVDLLRHTAGLTYAFLGDFMGANAVEKMYLDGGVNDVEITNAELVTRVAAQPLRYQPQTTWQYSRATDVLGRLVEVVSGMTLGEYFEANILAPLGMTDTGFYAKPENVDRLAQPFPAEVEGLTLPYLVVDKPPKFEAGGQGLTSTALDYAKFCQMMLNDGRLGAVRILGSNTAQLMHTDAVGTLFELGPLYLPGPSHGFGLGFAVRTEGGRSPGLLSPMHGSVGEYYWAGYAGTYFWIDPEEELVAVYMMQSVPNLIPYVELFKTLVMQSIID